MPIFIYVSILACWVVSYRLTTMPDSQGRLSNAGWGRNHPTHFVEGEIGTLFGGIKSNRAYSRLTEVCENTIKTFSKEGPDPGWIMAFLQL